jgi:ribonuclease P protein component
MRRSLSRAEKLRGRSGLQRVFESKAKAERKGIRVYCTENDLGWNRIAVCPVRTFGSAVKRNLAKRRCREAYRQLKPGLKPGYDLAFVLYPGDYTFADRKRQLESLLTQIDLLT